MASLSITFDDGVAMQVDDLTPEELSLIGGSIAIGVDDCAARGVEIPDPRWHALMVLADDIANNHRNLRSTT